ncbi:hypothetical protein [Paenibacillus amylolyticus]|uniref:hypothetical protein n=1 Tax=Paenibacillus amylolyticus TaxID=1451 RepID=UPI003D97B2E5
MANVQLPTVNTGETDTTELVKQLLNAYIMLTEELTFLLNNLDTRNVNELNADIINAGTINAALVTIKSELQDGAYIAIDGQGMKINDGTQDTFKADINGQVNMTGATVKNSLSSGYIQMSDQGLVINDGTKDTFKADINGQVTMTGAKVQSSENGYPRVEMNPDQNLVGAYSAANNYLTIQALGGSDQSPQVLIAAPNANMFMYVAGLTSFLGTTGANLSLTSNRNVYITPGNNIYDVIVPFDQFKDDDSGRTLYQELLGKARSGSQTGSSPAYNGGIPIGTVLQTAGGGTVTWTGIPSHSHTQN